jgi:GAF domain-containing protein
VSANLDRDQAGKATGLRWQLLELPPTGDQAADHHDDRREASPSLLAELVTGRPAGQATLTAVPGSAMDWDDLAGALERVVQTAVPLLRADGAGLMLADQEGALHWVTGTKQAERTFGRAERDQGEGPCIDAFTSGEVVWTMDLWADPRWPRLGPAARTNKIRGVLAAPVIQGGRPVGTCTR